MSAQQGPRKAPAAHCTSLSDHDDTTAATPGARIIQHPTAGRQTQALWDAIEAAETLNAAIERDVPLGADFEAAVCHAHRLLGRIVRDLCYVGSLG